VKPFKWIANIVAGICAALALAFLCYDHLSFQPRRAEIDALIAAAHPLDRLPPGTLRNLLLAESGDDLSLLASREVLFSLNAVPRDQLAWHVKSALWWLLVRLHLSEDEQISIVCSQTLLGKRTYGFQAGAQSAFGRDLDALNELELATLVVYARMPTRYREPERADDVRKASLNLIDRSHALRK
jgi:hypothetical protein